MTKTILHCPCCEAELELTVRNEITRPAEVSLTQAPEHGRRPPSLLAAKVLANAASKMRERADHQLRRTL